MSKKRKKKKGYSKIKVTILGMFFALILSVCIIAGYVLYNVVTYVNGDLVVNLDEYKANQNQTSFIYAKDSNGKNVEIARLHGDEDRVWVDLKDISPYMTKAFIALEDRRFEEHNGVDWIRIGGVIVKPQNIGQGGSTITQQLIKNITNNKDVTIVRKFREILMALNLERHTDKDTIIEAYLNTLYLGNGCYGVKTASEKYFGKDVSDLNCAECAVIASITQFPTKYNPLLNPENNKKRQLDCLKKMLDNGKITKAEYDEACNYHLIFTNSKDYVPDESDEEVKKTIEEETKINSFYVDAVINSVIEDLMDEYGYSKQQATNKIYYGGLKIYASVDLKIQEILEDVYKNRTNFPSIKKDDGTKPQSSMTIMDYKGNVVAIVGKAGAKKQNRELNRATSSWRQPGSTIKPIATYAPGIELNKITFSSKVKDYAIWVNGKLWPHNVDKSLGSNSNVTVQYAIQQSLNTVPTRLIKEEIGIDNSFEFLRDKFHLSRLDEVADRDLSPLATGALTNGTNTLEMAAAYATFGNGGKYYKPHFYSKVTNAQGTETVLTNENDKGEQVISSATSDIICELLQTVKTSYYGDAPNVRKFQIMAKTGTTSSDCDRWFCAGTPYYVASVWLGYDIKEPLNQEVNPCGKIFFTVFDRIHKGLKEKEFPKSDKAVEKRYCTVSGKIAGSGCYSTATGWYKEDNIPEVCTWCSSGSRSEKTTKSGNGDVNSAINEVINNVIPALTTQSSGER
ncbi:MAG: transglycosylase domain-containing protein [Clostridia bacterium]|nr:transglycosylase domain-containing protein [Clostridia bacterium]